MRLLFVVHSGDDRTASFIGVRQILQVAGQMFGHLLLGFLDESECPTVTERATRGAYRKCACVPDRAQDAGS